MVFLKQQNENGNYIDKDGVRYEILTCNITESKEYYETGEYETITDEEGNEIKQPIIASKIVINKGWDKFNSLAEAIQVYELTEIEK